MFDTNTSAVTITIISSVYALIDKRLKNLQKVDRCQPKGGCYSNIINKNGFQPTTLTGKSNKVLRKSNNHELVDRSGVGTKSCKS